MKIDLAETFPHLSHAPIVEAVIDLRAKSSVPWDYEALQAQLKGELTEYPNVQGQREYRVELKAGVGGTAQKQDFDLGWSGLLFRSKDTFQVTQFQKEGFAFSRVQQYQQWELFLAEAMRLWRIYIKVMRPPAIQRIGVRFINRMPVPAEVFRLEEYLLGSTQPLPSLGLLSAGFFHQDTLVVPDTSYRVNLIRTVQPVEGTPARIPVILDIDVFLDTPMELDDTALQQRLAEMRWLKNKVFFGSIAPKTKGIFQ